MITDDDRDPNEFMYHRKYFVNLISQEYGFDKKTVREIFDAIIFEAKDLLLENPNNRIIIEGFGSICLSFINSQITTDFDNNEFVQECSLAGKIKLSKQFKRALQQRHEEILKELDNGPQYGEEE